MLSDTAKEEIEASAFSPGFFLAGSLRVLGFGSLTGSKMALGTSSIGLTTLGLTYHTFIAGSTFHSWHTIARAGSCDSFAAQVHHNQLNYPDFHSPCSGHENIP